MFVLLQRLCRVYVVCNFSGCLFGGGVSASYNRETTEGNILSMKSKACFRSGGEEEPEDKQPALGETRRFHRVFPSST